MLSPGLILVSFDVSATIFPWKLGVSFSSGHAEKIRRGFARDLGGTRSDRSKGTRPMVACTHTHTRARAHGGKKESFVPHPGRD